MSDDAYRTPEGVPVTAVTADEMRAVDRVATEEYDLPLRSMMENLGRALAAVVRETGTVPVVVVAGAVGTGAAGSPLPATSGTAAWPSASSCRRNPIRSTGPRRCTAACSNRWASMSSRRPRSTGPPPTLSLGRRTPSWSMLSSATGLRRAPGGKSAALVDALATRDGPVVSLAVPSGLDATTGERPGPAVRPDRVLTLALPKTGLGAVAAPLQLADIGIPAGVYADLAFPYERPFDADRVDLVPRSS